MGLAESYHTMFVECSEVVGPKIPPVA